MTKHEEPTPMVWRSTEDDADDWTIESPAQAVYGTLRDIAALLPSGDYYLAERDGDDKPWVIVTANGENEVAHCPTEEEAVTLIGALHPIYEVTIHEISTHVYCVKADDEDEALAIARDRYDRGDNGDAEGISSDIHNIEIQEV